VLPLASAGIRPATSRGKSGDNHPQYYFLNNKFLLKKEFNL
jgi:hypothetical protein